jgi:aminoglycoside phosphotransferase (APT) family kinase protein
VPHDPLQLDVGAIERWLKGVAELHGPLSAQLLTGGRSNLTYLLSDVTGPRLVLRRPPLGELLPGAHDVGREYRIVRALHGSPVPVPSPIGYTDDPSWIGAPFAVTEFVDGLTLRRAADVAQLTPAGSDHLTARFATVLARLHQVDPTRTGRPPERGRDFIRRQLRIWSHQLEATPGRVLPRMREVGERLQAAAPMQRNVAIVHGDYRLDNALVARDGHVRAVIDWELSTLGDPLADLGIALAYWEDNDGLLPLGGSPTLAPQLGTRTDLLSAYERASRKRLDPSEVDYYVAFGTWRFAAILEGVYQRHLHGAYGEAPDGEWRRLEHVVPGLAERANSLFN